MEPPSARRVPELLLPLPQVFSRDRLGKVLGGTVACGRGVHKVAKVGVVDHAAVDAACAPRDARHALRAELRPRVLCHVQRRRRLDGQRHSVEFARQTARETCAP